MTRDVTCEVQKMLKKKKQKRKKSKLINSQQLTGLKARKMSRQKNECGMDFNFKFLCTCSFTPFFRFDLQLELACFNEKFDTASFRESFMWRNSISGKNEKWKRNVSKVLCVKCVAFQRFKSLKTSHSDHFSSSSLQMNF